MALKLAIDVPVNDGDFQAFMGLFAKFQAAAEKTPEIWEAIGAKTEAAKRDFLSAATALNLQAEARASVAESAKNMATASDKTASAWKKIGTETKSIAGNLASMTGSLFSLTAFTGVFAGLAGFAGSLFGIPSLAASVSERRRQAIGYGADYGQLTSFGVNFQRYFDPSAVAGGVASGQYDIQSPEYLALANTGLASGGGGTVDVSLDLVERTRSEFSHVPQENIGPTLRARHLDAMFSPQDIARLESTSPEEFMAQREAARKDAKTFELMEPALRRLQDFRTQLDNSGSVMSAKIAEGLSSAVPQLTRLSGSFAHLIDVAANNPTIAKWIGEAAAGLEFFAKEIGSDQFKDDEKKLFDSAGILLTNLEMLGGKFVDIVTAGGRFVAFLTGGSYQSAAQGNPGMGTWDIDRVPHGPYAHDPIGTGIAPNADRLAAPYRPHGPHHGDLPQGDTPGPGSVFRARYPSSSTAQAAPPANETQQELVDRIQQLRPDLTNEQCVTLAFASAGIPYTNPEILSLRAGPSATSQKLPIGTPVMTHFDWKRGYGDTYAAGGTGTAGIGRDHMGVIAGYNPDGSVILMNQWAGSGGPRLTTYKPGDRPGTEHDADAYSAILDAQGLPAGTYEGNPLRRQTLRDIGYDRFSKGAEAMQKALNGRPTAPPSLSDPMPFGGMKPLPRGSETVEVDPWVRPLVPKELREKIDAEWMRAIAKMPGEESANIDDRRAFDPSITDHSDRIGKPRPSVFADHSKIRAESAKDNDVIKNSFAGWLKRNQAQEKATHSGQLGMGAEAMQKFYAAQKPDDAPPAIPPNWFSRDPNAAHMSGDSGTDFSGVGRPAETGHVGPHSMLDHYPGLHRIDETSVVDHTSGAVLVHVAGAHYSVTV